MAVILKKDEKIESVALKLPNDFTIQDFVEKYREMYNEDWLKLEKTYADHVRKSKPGKIQPMPTPEQYLKNALHVWRNKTK